ncbi:MAG TPA: transglycosylase domain-containing protein [Candidatus Dormibacteraeota bacterium]|nr:transglycosylase domain-containing protein [Candidatus Dormibacteraeota bacterium]
MSGAPSWGAGGYGRRQGTPVPGSPRQRGRLRRLLPWAALILVVLVSGVFGYVLWTVRDLPDPGQTPIFGHSILIYDRSGNLISQINNQSQYYDPLSLQQMGRWAPVATLAAEDRNFYHHGALDYTSIARSAATDVAQGGFAQGGSTITQQLIKISVLNEQKTIMRKLQEAVLAIAMEQKYSKDQILEMYLNRVYYGYGAYGIGAATKVYFGAGKDPATLDPAQAAFLAALINGPGYYDPATHFDRARARQLYVLQGMVAMGALTQAEADQAAKEDIKSELKFDLSFLQSKAPHFSQYVMGQLDQLFGANVVQQGGFKVYTTLDLGLQAKAQQAVQQGVARLAGTGVNNGDLLAADPRTGAILAWVGSADFHNDAIAGQVDVVQSPRQPGSSFKPYVYEAALKDHRITLASILEDVPTTFPGDYRPLDWDNRWEGPITARQALVRSRNVPAVTVAQMEGMDNVIAEAQAQGITSKLQPYLSTAIGASAITLFENVQGYQVFANQGTLVPLMSITRVTDDQGNVLFQRDPGTQPGIRQVLTPAEAYLITDTLKDYQRVWGLGWNRQMAGKSGTTGGSATGVHRDAWMMAYNPDIVVGAWTGHTQPPGVNANDSISTFGTQVGQTVLRTFINGLPGTMRDWYRQPAGIVRGSGCPGQGSSGEIFLAGTQEDVSCPTPTPTPTPRETPTPESEVPAGPTPTATPTGPFATLPPRRRPTPLPTLPAETPVP